MHTTGVKERKKENNTNMRRDAASTASHPEVHGPGAKLFERRRMKDNNNNNENEKKYCIQTLFGCC